MRSKNIVFYFSVSPSTLSLICVVALDFILPGNFRSVIAVHKCKGATQKKMLQIQLLRKENAIFLLCAAHTLSAYVRNNY